MIILLPYSLFSKLFCLKFITIMNLTFIHVLHIYALNSYATLLHQNMHNNQYNSLKIHLLIDSLLKRS